MGAGRMAGRIPKKLRQLEEFLNSDAVCDDAMLLSELDGFMAGLAVGPALIMPSEWIPVIWAGEEPIFDSEEQAQNFMGLLMDYYNDVIRKLDQNKYMPIYDQDNDGGVFWEIWLEGFFRAVLLRPDDWLSYTHTEDEKLQQSIFILMRLHEMITAPDGFEAMEIDAELENAAPDLIPESVVQLHEYRKRTARPPASNDDHPLPKTGRNDPCPCGSGKKFKKCCLQ